MKKKSQAAVFLILVLIIAFSVIAVLLFGRYVNKKISQPTTESKERVFDVHPINNYATDCLSLTSKNALKILGKQGGYIFKSQGGPLLDYQNTDEGLFYLNYENSRVVYNILKPRFSYSPYSNDIPEYPWATFPYPDGSSIQENFAAQNVYGLSNLPPLNKSFGQQSIKEQLLKYINTNIGACLNFTIFEEQGYKISKGDKQIKLKINQEDVTVKMDLNLTIDNPQNTETTKISEFIVKHDVRLLKLYEFVKDIINSDISDVSFDIGTAQEPFNIIVYTDVFNKDDVIVVQDSLSNLDGSPYEYVFARKNRNPALFFISRDVIRVPALDANGERTIVTANMIVSGFPNSLDALDPDEDAIASTSYSITVEGTNIEPPVSLGVEEMRFKVTVTDLELEDYQIIRVIGELNT